MKTNINDEGTFLNVSFGTAMGNDLEYYKNIPLTSMPYGQPMVILCLDEYLRVFLNCIKLISNRLIIIFRYNYCNQ
ncbi:Rhamnogalacturonides degradation protein RhiN [Gilliamella apicola]|nr:Rhamnogalacturonides degradation protein RhiN [Gilliamella apicola]